MSYLIHKNAYYRLEHCYSCAVPGYLILSPNQTVMTLDDLPVEYQRQLGINLATASELIKTIIRPIKIYCTQFGEENANLHFHIFPRTTELTREFLKTFPDQRDTLHGPVLLDWAREAFRCERDKISPAVSSVIEKMRQYIDTHQQQSGTGSGQ